MKTSISLVPLGKNSKNQWSQSLWAKPGQAPGPKTLRPLLFLLFLPFLPKGTSEIDDFIGKHLIY